MSVHAVIPVMPAAPGAPWNDPTLFEAPAFSYAPEHDRDGMRAIFYDGPAWQGGPTRIFAYIGMPDLPPGVSAPAMVLIHGGGGSAFAPWVKLWVSRGYAAIAMDTCGCICGTESGGYSGHQPHPDGGPRGWGGFDQLAERPRDQWTWQAVAAAILGHSLLRAQPGVDPDRVGLTGISWGGYLTCIVAGVDPRFRFAAPVYGCGFLGDNSTWLPNFERMGPDAAATWLGLWDPSIYLPGVRVPMLWVTGTNDFAYPLDSLQKSYRLPTAATTSRTLCIRLRMAHGHAGPGENPAEILAFADTHLRGGLPLAKSVGVARIGDRASATFAAHALAPLVRAELTYTLDLGRWPDRVWHTVPADLDSVTGVASSVLPAAVAVYYFNVYDHRDLVSSSEHVDARR